EAITPYLLNSLEKMAANGRTDDDSNAMLSIFALFLLAQFREQKAYPIIINVINRPAKEAEYLLGDITTEGLNRILASVYDGELAPLQAVIENDKTYEFVRSAAIRAITVLYFTGQLERDTILAYFKTLYQERLERSENLIWGSLVDYTGQMGLDELLPEVKLAFQDDLVDDMYCSLSDVENMLMEKNSMPEEESDATLITNTVEELQWWAAFRPEPEVRSAPREPVVQAVTTVRDGPKVGRNDPCPCGSGKKFKKCCGR
nr:DUF1186 domain-containing protein [Endozoicomonas sp.]